MRGLDNSWQTMLTTLIGLSLITLIGVGIRLLIMQTMQQRRERESRHVNERLRTLIVAYKFSVSLADRIFSGVVGKPCVIRDSRRLS